MYGEHLIYMAISVEIVAITAVLFFLAKAGLSTALRWVGYILLLVGFLIMVCTVTRGLGMMMHHKTEASEHCHMGGMQGGCPMMGRGDCKGDMKGCDMKECEGEAGECCKGDSAKGKMPMGGMEHGHHDKDSAKAKK